MTSSVSKRFKARETGASYRRQVIGSLSAFGIIFFALLAVNRFWIHPAYDAQIIQVTEAYLEQLASHLIEEALLPTAEESTFDLEPLAATAPSFAKSFQLWKIRLFDQNGRIVFSTVPAEVGTMNTKPYFVDRVLRGHTYSLLVDKNGVTKEGEPVPFSVVESYMPIQRGGKVLAVLELYQDVTQERESLNQLSAINLLLLSVLAFLATAILSLFGRKILHSGRALSEALVTAEENRYRAEEARDALALEIRMRREAQEAVVKAERLAAVGTLSGGVAHQFNNINSIALGYADLCLTLENLPEQLTRYLKRIREGILRAKEITSNLLSFVGAAGHTLRRVNLNILVRRTLRPMKEEYERDGIIIRLELNDLPYTLLDPAGVNQVVLSLFSNAVHSVIGCRDRSITIRTGAGGNEQYLQVIDTGCGIPGEDLSRIFSPFFSTKGEFAPSDSLQGSVRGIGLGLSVCHAVVERHGGRIEVASTVGEGSCFTVWLPLNLAERSTTSSPHLLSRRKSSRIIVVEDESGVRDLLQNILGRHNFDICATDDGGEALALIQEEGAGLVLLDLKMKKMSGIEFLEKLSEWPEDDQPPVLILTGLVTETGDIDFEQYPAVAGLLTKPFETSQLLGRIREILALDPEGK